MKMFKNLLFAILGVLFLLPISVSANSATSVTLETYHFTNGDYLETILIQDALPRAATSTRSGQKTTYYKSASGTVLWSVTVRASFSYVYGISSTCTSVTGSSASNSAAWKVSNASTSKSGNRATATATGYHYEKGQLLSSYTRSVSLSCDIYGSLS